MREIALDIVDDGVEDIYQSCAWGQKAAVLAWAL